MDWSSASGGTFKLFPHLSTPQTESVTFKVPLVRGGDGEPIKLKRTSAKNLKFAPSLSPVAVAQIRDRGVVSREYEL